MLAVAPEYAVANVAGANRILIGLGWSGIALLTVARSGVTRDAAVEQRGGLLANAVTLERRISVEISFLFAATAYAFFVPLSGGIGPLNTLILVGLYAMYLIVIIRGNVENTDHHGGVPAYFQQFSRPAPIAVVLTGFAFSGAVIFTAVHPFAEGLEQLGLRYGIQVFAEFYIIRTYADPVATEPSITVLCAVTVVYLLLGVGLLVVQRDSVGQLGGDHPQPEGAD